MFSMRVNKKLGRVTLRVLGTHGNSSTTVLVQGSRCEFTIGLDADEQPTVGFCLGAYKDGITAVVPPAGCRNVSAAAAACAGLLQRFVRERSRLPAWDKRCNSGALHTTIPSAACCS